jgi:hypothetical protein
MPRSNPFLEGSFSPVSDEITAFDLPVTGRVPAELNGRYLRNGPNPLGLDDPNYHWFLGPGMVHGVRLRDGRAEWYRNRWVRSRLLAAALGEPWPGGPVHDSHDFAANTHIISHGGHLLATVEAGPLPYQLSCELDTLGPFTAMLLSTSLAHYALGAGQVLVAIFLAITIALGGWLTGQWMLGGIDQDSLHAGYFLPTVAGGLVGAFAAAQVHFHSVAEVSFGIGVLCWALLGSLVLNRLFFRPRLAGALFPTMAIELAPPAVAGVAYFAITGGATGPVAEALAGYAVLMALVQLRLLPIYARFYGCDRLYNHIHPCHWRAHRGGARSSSISSQKIRSWGHKGDAMTTSTSCPILSRFVLSTCL